MSEPHLTKGESERFSRGEMGGARTKEVVQHLLRGCSRCQEKLRLFFDGTIEAASSADYDVALYRAYAAAISKDRRARPGEEALAAWGVELLRSRGGVQGITDEELEELRGWPLIQALLQLSFEERYRDPGKMIQLALFARVVADNLTESKVSPLLKADYRALTWAELGNAYRVAEYLDKAGETLGGAEDLRTQGTGNPLVLARLLDLRASYMADRRYLSDACELLEAAQLIYEKVGDDHLAGRSLVKQGLYTNYGGDPPRALGLLRHGLAKLDRDRDPQLYATASENLVFTMAQCGRYREAATFLMESGLREALADQPLSLFKLRWVEGQIFAGLGKPRRAEVAFKEARAGFLAHGQAYNAALVGLDEAEIWLGQGKHPKVRALAEEMIETFQRLGIAREGVRAAEYLRAACDRDRVDTRLLRHVSRFLQRLEREPQVFFQAM